MGKWWKLRLQTRTILMVAGLMLLIVGLMGGSFYSLMVETVEKETGQRALNLAETLAGDPELIGAFGHSQPWSKIQPMAERIRKQSGAQFVVVGNHQGIRYAHPIPERIGRQMVGGDNDRALVQGESYVSKATGSLGPSLRGKAPVFNEEGEVIGIVSVGFLMEEIADMTQSYLIKMLHFFLLALAIGVVGAIWLARSIKHATLGLEPEEISSLYKERSAVIEAVREGIVVVDRQGRVTMVNQAASRMLGLPAEQAEQGRDVRELLPHTRLPDVVQSGERELDRHLYLNGREIIVNRYPIRSPEGSRVVGAVASFRLKSELDELNDQLSQVSRYTEALRSQTHEFHNTLYTISGLIQLGSYREALEMIHQETVENQDRIQRIVKGIPDPRLGGILLGFINRARELKVDFTLDQDSRLRPLPEDFDRQGLVHILGNLITNAFEAVEQQPEGERRVRLYIGDAGGEVLLEVEDSGPGVKDRIADRIWERGFSTKRGEKRGLGLPKVKETAVEMGGYIALEHGELGGALFVVALPRVRGCKPSEGGMAHG
ncbi:sensor histidine kinase [Desmospora profundinema]|uniref:histidine kinase n=1 Tax=Desmospora profundinema TaxID=1571184 RepID=A0ABU1IN40_9BACL|nr:sensor histidine kinase [Desmospora profundinema]MDR6226196.1 two-component system CitB family sensor kinase [Desmospora profundinema]